MSAPNMTPQTAMNPAHMTPMPEFVRANPKKALAIAAVAFMGVVVAIVVVTVVVLGQVNKTTAVTPPIPSVPPVVVAQAPPPPVVPLVPVAAALVPPTPPEPPASPLVEEPKRAHTKREEQKREDQRREEQRREEKREEKRVNDATPPVVVSGTGTLKFLPKPKKAGWVVSIDGGTPSENQQFTLAAGPHKLVITAPGRTGPPIVKVIEIPASGVFAFTETLDQ